VEGIADVTAARLLSRCFVFFSPWAGIVYRIVASEEIVYILN
jgi:hypothetical protein